MPLEGGISMKKSFLGFEKPIITAMVQGNEPDRIKYLMDKALVDGADAFGMQLCVMKKEFRNSDVYRDLFSYAKDKPCYVTNYRHSSNEGKTDDVLAEEMLEIASCGATLCDVMADYFDRQDDELAKNEDAIKRQMEFIDKLHDKGAEVLMSSHVLKFTPAERVMEIALEHKRRGADISKIVTHANTMEEQIENLRIINMLKENLGIPFLYLCGGECSILRRIGAQIGSCMSLAVHEYDNFATPTQPPIKAIKLISENM